MKRFIFSVIALIMAATSCTESGLIDMPEFYQNPIVFDTYIGKTPVTKAVNCDIEQLLAEDEGVRIYGFKADKVTGRPYDYVDYSSAYLNGRLICTNLEAATKKDEPESPVWQYQYATVTTNNGAELTTWTPDEPYMPTDKDLAVVAYNLKAAGKVGNNPGVPYMTNISTDKTQFDFTVFDDVASQLDLVVTPLTFVTETGETTQVPLRFYHVLSRVGFKVQSSSDSDTKIYISSIKLKGQFAKKGSVDMKLAIATPNSSTNSESNIVLKDNIRPKITPITTGASPYQTEYELLPGEDNIFETDADECYETAQQISTAGNNCYMMIMPGIQENASVEITYKLGDSDPRPVTIDLDALNDINYFEAGSAYEFIFKLSTSAIEFSANIVEGGWDEQTPNPIN